MESDLACLARFNLEGSYLATTVVSSPLARSSASHRPSALAPRLVMCCHGGRLHEDDHGGDCGYLTAYYCKAPREQGSRRCCTCCACTLARRRRDAGLADGALLNLCASSYIRIAWPCLKGRFDDAAISKCYSSNTTLGSRRQENYERVWQVRRIIA